MIKKLLTAVDVAADWIGLELWVGFIRVSL